MTNALLLAVLVGQVDYEALVMEVQRLRADADVVNYLSGNPVEAQQLSALERNLERSLALAQEYRQRAEEARRGQQFGAIGMLAGDTPVGRMGQQIYSSTPDPSRFDIAASERIENARDALVGLVSRYRDIKARAMAQKEIAVSKPRSKPAPASRYTRGCQKDTDCKGDRICERGHCVSSAPGVPAP